MPNGDGLLGNPSSTQSGLSVPIPGQNELFYLFTSDANENSLANGLRYSIVDMNLDGGLGDVTSTKNVLLHYPATEKISVIPHANNIDYWVIAHDWGTNNFLVYLITSSGLNTTPVISSVGSIHQATPGPHCCGNSVGYIKGSPNGSKLALAIHADMIVELFDFDRATGIASNPITSNTFPEEPYGIEFSPDGTKLYVSTIYANSKIYQFDITTPNFFNNPTVIASTTNKEYGSLMLAPDAKIYIALYASTTLNYLGVINNPNDAGIACNFIENGINLSTGKSIRGLPNMFYYNSYSSVIENGMDHSLSVFPNPIVNNHLVYISGVLPKDVDVSIFDICGEKVFFKHLNNFTETFYMDIQNIDDGIYFLKVVQQSETKTVKLVIENNYK